MFSRSAVSLLRPQSSMCACAVRMFSGRPVVTSLRPRDVRTTSVRKFGFKHTAYEGIFSSKSILNPINGMKDEGLAVMVVSVSVACFGCVVFMIYYVYRDCEFVYNPKRNYPWLDLKEGHTPTLFLRRPYELAPDIKQMQNILGSHHEEMATLQKTAEDRKKAPHS